MGICGGKSNTNSRCYIVQATSFKQVLNKFEKSEIEILKLIYKDLASRNRDTVITKECFSEFFNMIGLWGELVFDNFDKKHNSIVDYEEFISGISFYTKCAQEDKIKNLFELYDLNREGGIMKQEFHQMLMNYPKVDIERLLDDQMFLANQNIIKMHDEQKIRQDSKKQTLSLLNQDLKESRKQLTLLIRRGSLEQSMILPQRATSNHNDDLQDSQQNSKRRGKQCNSIDMMFPSESMIASNGVPMGSIGCTLNLQFNGKLIEMRRVNLNYLVSKYVNMVFDSKQGGDRDSLSLMEFTIFVNEHPNIFNGLYRGFNYDLWGYHEELKQTRYNALNKDLVGYMMKLSRKGKQVRRYCELHQHFFIEFENKSSKLPNSIIFEIKQKEIICLDGLCVQEIHNPVDKTFGFTIFHKDKVYNSKTYFCTDQVQFQAWTNKLLIFEKASITEHYNLVNKIGEGRFSIVYQGTSKKDNYETAIKIIEKFKLTREEKLMLSHEAEIMKLLNHSCIIKLYETIETKTHLYIVTELVSDGDLFECMKKNKFLQEYDAALVMAQLFDTINYIHTIGIVHRDLKPENIMVVYQADKKTIKQVKIIDFGFANFLTNLQDHEEADDTLCGTANYLAPETLNGKGVSFKVDNFSLGVIMFKMLTGNLPFDSEFPEEIIANILECKYELDDDIWSLVSVEAKDLVQKLLMKDPLDRIHLSEAMNHSWIKSRQDYKNKVRSCQTKQKLLF